MDRTRWIELYRRTRAETERLAAPLSAEDQVVQALPETSPTKWHRAHTTWFFETFVLLPCGVAAVDPRYAYLFNSYYETLGPRLARPKRGLLSRPSTEEVAAYRAVVDGRLIACLEQASDADLAALAPILALGLAHEEQHQELILTDILAALAENRLQPVYAAPPAEGWPGAPSDDPVRFISFEEGLHALGARPGDGFTFDNEGPRHRVFVSAFALAHRPISVAEVAAFAAEGGYRTPTLWLERDWLDA